MGDIFSTFFGGGFDGGGSAQGRRKKEIGGDIEIQVSLDFSEAYSGVKKEVTFSKNTLCPDCHGSGAKSESGVSNCPDCNGSGRIRKRMQTLFGVVEQAIACDRCDGSGKIIKESCPTCRGKKIVTAKRTRTIDVPA